MTESEWLECTDPTPMLESLRGKASDRKLRLFACACCRSIWHLFVDERTRTAVDVSELYAEEQASSNELEIACTGAEQAKEQARRAAQELAGCSHGGQAREIRAETPLGVAIRAFYAAQASQRAACGPCGVETALGVSSSARGTMQAAEHVRECVLLRDIFGNPFHPVTIDAAWRTPAAKCAAAAALDHRQLPGGELDAGDLALLADALEAAGCTEAAVVDHLRKSGPHVKGCWVVDLVLESE